MTSDLAFRPLTQAATALLTSVDERIGDFGLVFILLRPFAMMSLSLQCERGLTVGSDERYATTMHSALRMLLAPSQGLAMCTWAESVRRHA